MSLDGGSTSDHSKGMTQTEKSLENRLVHVTKSFAIVWCTQESPARTLERCQSLHTAMHPLRIRPSHSTPFEVTLSFCETPVGWFVYLNASVYGRLSQNSQHPIPDAYGAKSYLDEDSEGNVRGILTSPYMSFGVVCVCIDFPILLLPSPSSLQTQYHRVVRRQRSKRIHSAWERYRQCRAGYSLLPQRTR